MYVTFKINECATGKDVRLSSIISEGELYKVPGYFNFTLDENSVKHSGTNLSFEDALERTKSRIERKKRIDKMNPSNLSKEFEESFSNIYLENPKRVIKYMNNYDLILETGSRWNARMFDHFFPDVLEKDLIYEGRDKDGNVINPFSDSDPINMKKLHKEPIRIQGPDDSLEIERFTTSNLAPRRNVKKDYFNKVLNKYIGFSTVKDEEIGRCISLIKKYLGEKDKYDKSEVVNLIRSIKDIPNKLTNTLFRILNGIKDLNLLSCEEVEKLKSLYDTFERVSNEVLGKSVKYKQNVLFHLLRKIGKEPNIEDFYIKGSKSTKRLDEEIGKVFARLGWEFRLI